MMTTAKNTNMLRKKFTSAFSVLCLSTIPFTYSFSQELAPASSLDELLERVVQGRTEASEINQRRMSDFVEKRDQQEALLIQAKQDIERADAVGESLGESIAENTRELETLDTELKNSLGNFEELFGVTRQVAADTRAQINGSIISAQFPNRTQALDDITLSKSLPTVEQLKALWIILLQEQTEQGKVSQFTTLISDGKGLPIEKNVTRVGPFVAISEGGFLTIDSTSNRLSPLARQPGGEYVQSTNNLRASKGGEIVRVAVDPSRGTILNLLVDSPSLAERFNQGGLPGYIVTCLAVIGLLIGFQRLFSLSVIGARVRKQMNNKTITTNNPLGRILQAYEDNPKVDVETLELKLNDAVLKEVPYLDRGLNILKVLAAVAPLMGLLGTVVGMIVTFQTITMWGTGEPKLMAGGISQALVTTVQGLVAAIPLLLLHSVTSGRARSLQHILEEQSAGLVARRAEQNQRGR